tara:strand:+ start:1095 stop:1751 length:657 start_codon:yes stop_codon:yes gene_type:complete
MSKQTNESAKILAYGLGFAAILILISLMSFKSERQTIDESGKPILGNAYVKLEKPISGIEKTNITELFWYGCPHCYNAEPIADELSTHSDKSGYDFRKVHFYSERDVWHYDFMVYIALSSLGVEKDVGKAYMLAVQGINQDRLDRRNIFNFLNKHGISKTQFESAMKSKKAKEFESYAKLFVSDEISGTPIFIVSGKYIVYDVQNMNSVVDYLVNEQP